MDGIIVINKPQNMTSHDVISILRKKTGIKRIGHCGTLDPMATGVLPCMIGNCTRILEYLDSDYKTYFCRLELGITTDTGDIWGNILNTEKDIMYVTEENVFDVIRQFKGRILQKPPMYSAIKVNGRKLYEYARAGETVDIKEREVYIKCFTVDNLDIENRTIDFTVVCSKGTYVRSICEKIGTDLGCGAVMTRLTRLRTGIFDISDSLTIDEIQGFTPDEISDHLIEPDVPLAHLGKVVTNPEWGRKFCDGWHLSLKDCIVDREPECYDDGVTAKMPFYTVYKRDNDKDVFLGTAVYSEKYKKLVAHKVLYRG